MAITLYTAPDCIRCKIVKAFFAEKNIEYGTLDFKADAKEFNAFYRANRPSIYRNPEGVEFPLFDDGTVIKQGSGEIIAYLLSGQTLAEAGAVTRSDLLHGWISGLYVSQVPAGQEDNFVTVVQHLHAGGLSVCLQTDGRNPALLERLLGLGIVAKVRLTAYTAPVAAMLGGAPTAEDLGKTVELVRKAQGEICLFARPAAQNGEAAWPTRAEMADAAKALYDACGDHQLPCMVMQATAEMPLDMMGLEAAPDALMLKYRSAAREFLFKTDILK